MSRTSRLRAGLLAAATVVVACGTAGGAAVASQAGHAKKSLTTLQLDYVPYSNDSSLFLGIKRGYFRQNGLKISLTTAVAPTFVVAAMESGQEQLGFVTTVVAVNLAAHGTTLKCVSSVDGNQTSNAAQDGTLLVANPSSGISSVKDLVGKTVATVQLASLNTLTVQEMVKDAGINPGSVHFVSMPFAQMPQALQQGTVQAAVITTPFSETAIANGAKLIAHPNVVEMAGQSTTCFAATNQWVSHHVKIAKEFQTAMDEAIAYTKSHPAAAAATLPAYGLATSLQNAEQAKLGTDFNPTILPSSLSKVGRLLERFGYITTIPDPNSLIFPGA